MCWMHFLPHKTFTEKPSLVLIFENRSQSSSFLLHFGILQPPVDKYNTVKLLKNMYGLTCVLRACMCILMNKMGGTDFHYQFELKTKQTVEAGLNFQQTH